jgi:hypothetical protein
MELSPTAAVAHNQVLAANSAQKRFNNGAHVFFSFLFLASNERTR